MYLLTKQIFNSTTLKAALADFYAGFEIIDTEHKNSFLIKMKDSDNFVIGGYHFKSENDVNLLALNLVDNREGTPLDKAIVATDVINLDNLIIFTSLGDQVHVKSSNTGHSEIAPMRKAENDLTPLDKACLVVFSAVANS